MKTLRCAFLAGAAISALYGDARSEAVERLLAPLKGRNVPGCAIGVMRDGLFLYQTAFGLANLERGEAITAETAFNVASMSKQFTAAALYFLLAEGRVRLGDPVRRFIPELPEYAAGITVADLLHHTSGLRDISALLEVAGRLGQPPDVAGNLHLLAAQTALNFPPGSDYEYTNSDYLVLGIVVERVAEMPLAGFAEERLFRPLAMANSQFRSNLARLAQVASGYTGGMEGNRATQFRPAANPYLLAGDGGLYTSLADLLRWDENFYSGAVGGPGYLEFMATRGQLRSGQRLQYASGLQVGRYRGLRSVSHNGWLPGFRSELIRFPARRLSVACLCNRSDVDSAALARAVASIYLAGKLKRPRRPASLDYVTSGFPLLGGTWRSKQGWLIRAWSAMDALTVELPEGRYKMLPLNRRQLFADDGGFPLTLTELSRDRIQLAWDGTPPVVYDRVETVTPGERDLDSLAGEYRSADADARYTISIERGWPVVRGPGWRMVLDAVDANRFLAGPWSLEFVRTDAGEVQGIHLHGARLWDLWFRKTETAATSRPTIP